MMCLLFVGPPNAASMAIEKAKAKANADAVADPERMRRTARGELFCLPARNGGLSFSGRQGKKVHRAPLRQRRSSREASFA
jgi:hypothetical protein